MLELPFRARPSVACFTALLLLADLSFVVAGERTISGTITSFECGDNCYLTIASTSGKEHVGLCAAPQCAPWNEVAEMPQEFIGDDVSLIVGVGVQFDGSGDPVGEMLAFEKIDFTR